MINLWNYVNAKKIKITSIDNETFTGNLVCIEDAEENGADMDEIVIEIKSDTIIGFLQNEVKSIEVLK